MYLEAESLDLSTFRLQSERSTNCAIPPRHSSHIIIYVVYATTIPYKLYKFNIPYKPSYYANYMVFHTNLYKTRYPIQTL